MSCLALTKHLYLRAIHISGFLAYLINKLRQGSDWPPLQQ
jgi:hypothetical protein